MFRWLAIVLAFVLAVPPVPADCARPDEPLPAPAEVGCHGAKSASPLKPPEDRPADPCPCCDGCCDCAPAPAISLSAASAEPTPLQASFVGEAKGHPHWTPFKPERPPNPSACA